MARDLQAFVVPDARLARAAGLDLEAAGLRPVVTPRHATVLTIVGPLPEELAMAAVVAYAQMPRPRAILAVGSPLVPGLPEPDVVAPLGQEGLRTGVGALRRLLAEGAFAPVVEAMEGVAVQTRTEFVCPMHPEVVQPEPGRCPLCGMNLVPKEDVIARPQPGQREHDAHAAAGSEKREMDHAMMGHDDMGHAGMGEGMMDHSMHGGSFMSMVAMTEHLPPSADGLPMEWVAAPFGPLFPGLPGGLDVTFTLDGDGVAEAAATVATARGMEATWPGPIESFPDRLARVDPLAPVAYRILARRALEAAAGVEIGQAVACSRIRDAEWERVGSHIGWLAEFGSLIGDRWIADRAADLQIEVARVTSELSARLMREIRGFAAAVARAPLIGRRLHSVGTTKLNAAESVSGPVARAAGIAMDARLGDDWYRVLGFAPVVRAGGDALARLQVRLAEIAASLDLLLAAAERDPGQPSDSSPLAHRSGTGHATIETPRGVARLHIIVEHGAVTEASLASPSTELIRLVPDVTEGEEVADALVAVASLDLSPWEVNA